MNQTLVTPQAVGQAILQRYLDAYDGAIQGCCVVIADELATATGGAVVAGDLCWADCRRPHWWVVLRDGTELDPMGEYLFGAEPGFRHDEHHHDRTIFESLLPHYERFRVPLSDPA